MAAIKNGKSKGQTRRANEARAANAEAIDRAERQAEREAIQAEPAAAAPDDGPAAKLSLWVKIGEQIYKVSPAAVKAADGWGDPEHAAWAVEKMGHDTTYHLTEWESDIDGSMHFSCSCPGFVSHGMRCNGGRGCKHVRIIKAIRAAMQESI